MSLEFLQSLEAIVGQRLSDADTQSSYTARLAAEGIVRVAQKVGEEGLELALAAASQADDKALTGEAADLIYHMIVLLKMRGLSLADVNRLLAARHAQA